MTILSLASEQSWPQILAVAHYRPSELVLLHSDDSERSAAPARRLKEFFERSGLMAPRSIRLETLSYNDFGSVEQTLDALKLDLSGCALHFTGGNKLMATAAFRWATRRGVPSFYIERNHDIVCFEPRDGDVVTHPREKLNVHLTDGLDPLLLVRCQMAAGEIERDGQSLTWERGALRISGEADRDEKEGDRLEFETAETLLRLGVKIVRRSARLKVSSAGGVSSRRPVAEIDLLFNYAGRLWLVDCKDAIRTEWMADGLKPYLDLSQPKARKLFDDVRNALTMKQTKVLKEDILHVKEIAGLLGQAVAVRRHLPDPEVRQFARDHGVAFVHSKSLRADFETLLHPNRPADEADLASLRKAFAP
ncbi:MAG: hypothetical protein BWK77_05780 [Verrucomicrobia bacterium A1]|nr:MAG: hypothetical protein BWK77_05780 [Verrucomicrobia bacterium A1]